MPEFQPQIPALSSRSLNQLFRMAQGLRRDPLPGEHAANFAGPGLGVQLLDRRDGPAPIRVLLDKVMMRGKAGDLSQMRHAQDLAGSSQFLKPPAYRFGGAAANAGIHLVENQCSRDRVAIGAPRSDARLQRQRDAREFPARSDFIDRPELLANVR